MKKLITITISLIFLALSLNATSRASIENRKGVQSRDTKKLDTDRVKDLNYIPAISEEISRVVILEVTEAKEGNIEDREFSRRANFTRVSESLRIPLSRTNIILSNPPVPIPFDFANKEQDRFSASEKYLGYFANSKIYDVDDLSIEEISNSIWQDNMTSEEYLLTSQSRVIPHTYYWYLKRDYDSSTNLQKRVKIKKIKNIFSD